MGGDPPAPTPSETTAQRMQAFIQYFPEYLGTQLEQLPALQDALINATATASPQLSQIQTDLFRQFGPELNRIGQEISAENALAQAASDAAVVSGPGRDLVQEARTTAEVFDPEYFQTRALTADKLGALLNSFSGDLSLSGAERSEVERGLNNTMSTRGTLNTPSAIETLTAANQYGSAFQGKRDALQNALNTASNFLQTARSGTDTFQVATGRPSTTNQGANQFTGAQTSPGADVFDIGDSFLGGINEAGNLGMEINAGRRDSLDRVTGVLGSLPSYS